MGNNVRQLIKAFHINATVPADGEELNVGAGMCLMTIAVTGTGVGFNIVVETKSNDTDDWSTVTVTNHEGYVLSNSITANGKYLVPLETFTKIRCRLSAIQQNSVTIRGTVTN